MVLQIEIPPQTEQRLRDQAKAAGKDVPSYVSQLIEQAALKSSLEEILLPLRQQFQASGASNEQLADDITAAQSEYRAEKHEQIEADAVAGRLDWLVQEAREDNKSGRCTDR